eukprot:4750410-Pyramimonas_sp.AAC.1
MEYLDSRAVSACRAEPGRSVRWVETSARSIRRLMRLYDVLCISYLCVCHLEGAVLVGGLGPLFGQWGGVAG